MLRIIHRYLYSRVLSLKQSTYSRPEQLEYFNNKFESNSLYRQKLQYLKRLQQSKTLDRFYQNKSIQALNQQEIYFLLNSQMKYNISKKGQLQLMAKIKSTYFKCFLAKQFRWLGQIQQYLIIISFNEQLFDMTPYELTYCLQFISDFTVPMEELDRNRLHNKLQEFKNGGESIYNMILISGYLLQMNIVFKDVHNKQNLMRWFKQNNNFDFRAIYFIHKLSEHLGYTFTKQQKELLKGKMKTAILKLTFNYFQNNYLVFLMQYYPEQVKVLNILHFTPRAYIGYLKFYKFNQENKILQHKIPQSVIELADYVSFKTIIEYRIALGLDNALTLAKALPDYFSYSLKPVSCCINAIKQNKTEQLQVQYYIEKTIQSKFKLNQQFQLDIIEDYSINEMIAILSNLCKSKLCSISFWKKAVRWVQNLLDHNIQSKIIIRKHEAYTNLLLLVTSKNFKEQTRTMIFQDLVKLLSNSKDQWSLKSLIKLTRTLVLAKIGQIQIWLLIQKRIQHFFNRTKVENNPLTSQLFVRLVYNFNEMGKGSYKFWSTINDILDNKIKKQILQKIKNPHSIAHTHLKVDLSV